MRLTALTMAKTFAIWPFRCKANLEPILRGRPDGMLVNPFEIRGIVPDLFRAACRARGLGLEEQ